MAIIKYACLQLKERDLKISLKSKAKSKGNGKQNALISYAISNAEWEIHRYTCQSLSQTLRVNTYIHVYRCKRAASGLFSSLLGKQT